MVSRHFVLHHWQIPYEPAFVWAPRWRERIKRTVQKKGRRQIMSSIEGGESFKEARSQKTFFAMRQRQLSAPSRNQKKIRSQGCVSAKWRSLEDLEKYCSLWLAFGSCRQVSFFTKKNRDLTKSPLWKEGNEKHACSRVRGGGVKTAETSVKRKISNETNATYIAAIQKTQK